MTLDYYRIFYYVAKYKSFSKAARMLDNNQPNITRCMNILESELDCKLLNRSHKGITLTPEGKIAAAKALGASDDQSSVDLLLRFVDDADDDVVFAACESLRKVGSEHDTADLLARMQKIPEDRQAIRDEIGKTVQELHHRP